jgi:hypothetical protein
VKKDGKFKKRKKRLVSVMLTQVEIKNGTISDEAESVLSSRLENGLWPQGRRFSHTYVFCARLTLPQLVSLATTV